MDENFPLNSLKRRLVGGGAWIVGGRVSGIVIAMIASMVLARRLDPADYGVFLIVMSVLIFWTVVASFGLDRLLLRYISESIGLGDAERAVRTLKRIAGVAAATTIGGAAICAAFLGTFGSSQLGIPATTGVIVNCVIAIVAMTLLQLMAEAQRGLHQMMYASVFDAQNSAPLTNLLFLLQLLAHQGETLSFATALIYYVISLVVLIPLAAFCLWRTARRSLAKIEQSANGHPSQPAISLGQVLGMGLPLMLVQALTFGSTQADIWIAGYCCSDENVALFGAARRLMLIVGLPLAMINLTVLSTIPELYARRQLAELQRVLQTSAAVAAAPALLALALLLLAPGAMLVLIFGQEFYREASAALMILSIGQIVLNWTGCSGYALVVTGYHNVTLINQFVATIALIVLGITGASLYGITGLAAAAAIVMGGSNLALWIIARKKMGIWTHPSIPWSFLSRLWGQQRGGEPACEVANNSL